MTFVFLSAGTAAEVPGPEEAAGAGKPVHLIQFKLS
jgi:hypothetical protein